MVSEDSLTQANRLAVARTGIPVDPTGSSGLAGLLEMRRSVRSATTTGWPSCSLD